jgi:hypothetical protein
MFLLPLLLLSSLAYAGSPAVEALYQGFRNPPPEYSVSPYWFWNGQVTEAETRRQIREMAGQGVRSAVVMNWAGLEPAFLSEEWWKQIGYALDAAREAGVTLNFSDEYLWPSAQAWDYGSLHPEPSRVLQLHPEYRMRRLVCREFDAGPAVTLDAAPEVIVAARVGPAGEIDEPSLTLVPPARAVNWKAPGPGWKLFVYTPEATVERDTRVDLMNPAAVRVYLDLVYEQFARRFPSHLGKTIRFFVSDHEGAYGAPLPFTPALWKAFQDRHGYDLRRYLPLAAGDTPRAVKTRQDYLDTVSHLYTNSYVQQVTDWCTAHGVRHGHSDIEETLSLQVRWTGDMFRIWRASSAIFIDALLSRARMPIDFQEALSIAHFEGRPLLVENQGLTGHDSYWSLEKARAGTNMCLLWGANRLIPHYFEYDPTHIQYPPSWFLTQPLWRYFHHYADVVRRGQFLNAQGRHQARIAIYAPLESAVAGANGVLRDKDRLVLRWNNPMDQTQDYYSALQLELTRHGWDYHILDAHYLGRAELAGPGLRLAGEEFRVLILPPMTHIAPESARRIRQFAEAGGMVLALGRQPSELDGVRLRRFPIGDHAHFMDKLNYTVYVEAPEPFRADLAPVLAAIRAEFPPSVEVVSGSRDKLYFSHRLGDGVEWYWAVNDTPDARRVTVRFPAAGAFEKWDAESGERSGLFSQNGTVTLEFGPWDAYFVVRHAGPSLPAPKGEETRRVLVRLPDAGWQFTPESDIRVPYAQVDGAAEPVWLAPERLANRNWWMAGPYPYRDHVGFFEPLPPERGFTSGPEWKWVESPTAAVRPPTRGEIYYAFVNVWSPEERQGQAAIAVADSVKLWWNDKLEFTHHSHPPFVNLRDPWSHRPSLQIRKGWNTVLMKIGPAHAGATGFLFRITDAEGNTLRDLVYAKDRSLPARESRKVRLTVAAPPGTSRASLSLEMEEREIPERPVVFPAATTSFTLASWTDSTLAHYSGSALYETTFDLDAVPAGERLVLDLGAVGLAAEVWVNGSKAGERAWRPYELDITSFVRRGSNRLRVRVANSNAGWSAQGDPVYERGAWGVQFKSERDRLRTLRPNGLEGPVQILAVRR